MQRKLDTIQKKAKLNEIWTLGEPGPGGAYHDYMIVTGKNQRYDFEEWPRQILLTVSFQEGPRNAQNSNTGVLDSDLLEIVRDRLKAFQASDMATEYNAQALLHVEKALKLMNMRVEDRLKRGVLGTMEK